ncbi:MAG: hypothetical protein V2B15_00900 [Bacteroidota bacterium]
MRRILIIALLLVCTVVTTIAQNETQELRYSMHNPFGTARYAAQGGAIGALGGDLSAAQVNPAGFGFYRSSEFSFSPSFYWVNTSSDYLGTVTGDSRFRFNIGSLGYVAAFNRKQKTGIVGASFAVGYNTLVNFNNRTSMNGTNNQSSLLDDFTWRANDNPGNLNSFYEQVASDAFLLPYDSVSGRFWNDIQDGGYGQQTFRLVEQSGYIGEYSFSTAVNISNLLYFGATLGIQSVRFYEDIYHAESDPDHVLMTIDDFQFREFNSTSGWGYNFRFGMIFRPVHSIRLGASIQIPTFYYLEDEKYTDANSSWDQSSGIHDGNGVSPYGYYDYKLKSPMKVNAHASVILFKMATVSAAYEYMDYSAARLDSYNDRFLTENENIRNNLREVHNLRAGAEVRIDLLYFRTGVQYLMSPYADPRNDAREWIWSGGLGVRTKAAFIDISYSRGNRTEVYGLYSPGNSVPESSFTSINQVNPNNLLLTMGLRF